VGVGGHALKSGGMRAAAIRLSLPSSTQGKLSLILYICSQATRARLLSRPHEVPVHAGGPFPPEAYDGVITTVRLDLGFTTGGELAWAVIAPTVGPPRGGLAGDYLGASGANVLIGGSQRLCLVFREPVRQRSGAAN
jgi:hypothetical protein